MNPISSQTVNPAPNTNNSNIPSPLPGSNAVANTRKVITRDPNAQTTTVKPPVSSNPSPVTQPNLDSVVPNADPSLDTNTLPTPSMGNPANVNNEDTVKGEAGEKRNSALSSLADKLANLKKEFLEETDGVKTETSDASITNESATQEENKPLPTSQQELQNKIENSVEAEAKSKDKKSFFSSLFEEETASSQEKVEKVITDETIKKTTPVNDNITLPSPELAEVNDLGVELDSPNADPVDSKLSQTSDLSSTEGDDLSLLEESVQKMDDADPVDIAINEREELAQEVTPTTQEAPNMQLPVDLSQSQVESTIPPQMNHVENPINPTIDDSIKLNQGSQEIHTSTNTETNDEQQIHGLELPQVPQSPVREAQEQKIQDSIANPTEPKTQEGTEIRDTTQSEEGVDTSIANDTLVDLPTPPVAGIAAVSQLGNQTDETISPEGISDAQFLDNMEDKKDALEHEKNVDEGMMETHEVNISNLLRLTVDRDASDLHITAGYPAMIRIDGSLVAVTDFDLTPEQTELMINEILPDDKKEKLQVNREVDLSYTLDEDSRFRINAFYQRKSMSAAFRLIPTKIKSIDELNLPQIYHKLAMIRQGLVLVTGPTGSGKSTTLISILNEVNMQREDHILTIEDPIEFILPKGKALVDQREVSEDTHSWDIALRSALRQDPDVILVGEMRDLETVSAAITLAETGHLVFATLHTNSAAQTMDRIIDVFPEHQQNQIRNQLANVLEAVIAQRLIPINGGGRRAVSEIMIATPGIRNLIREGKTHQLDNTIRTSVDIGMLSIEHSLVTLVRKGIITSEKAQEYAVHPEEVVRLLKA